MGKPYQEQPTRLTLLILLLALFGCDINDLQSGAKT